jgi:energy-coupling factor transporter ATP-binding protein EcfA2
LHESEVAVFGITDYFSADGYLRTLQEFNARYPESPKVLIPNIELRTNDVVNRAQEEVNVHVLFNPFRPSYQAKIRTFLQQLKTNKTDGATRPITATELSTTADFASATTLRHYIVEALETTFGKAADLLDNVLIVTAANNDGLRPERGKLRKLLITDELDKFSDAFFGSAKNVDYYLSKDRAEDKSEFTKPKPVLTGSDAHSLLDMQQRLGQVVSIAQHGTVHEPTWVKADPTFEGLKQIIYEPHNRVFIGPEPDILSRVRERKTRYIESLHISSIDGYREQQHGTWFKGEEIKLGKELTAIIGNKGNGKSALTDIIGMLANSHNQLSKGHTGQKAEELFSFLNREKFLKGGCAKQFVGTLNWYEGEADRKTLDTQVAVHLPEKVEYLPQKYLERICANIADDEFRLTLNEVIFRYVKRQDQYGQTSLEDLIRYLSQQAEEDIVLKMQELRKANAAVVGVEKKLTEDYRKEIEERLRLKKQEMDSHIGSAPTEKSNPGQSSGESAESARIGELAVAIAGIDAQVGALGKV